MFSPAIGAQVCMAAMLCILAPGLAAAEAANACSRPISLATGEWEPYGYHDAQGRFTGIDADMVRAIFSEARCTLVLLRSMPANRNLQLFTNGEIGLMSGASRTAEREKHAFFSKPYRNETVGLFSLADDGAQYAGIRSFAQFLERPHTLLAPRAGWYGPLYAKSAGFLRSRRRLSEFGDFSQGIRMLAAGRGSFILGDAAAIEHAAARQGVKVLPLPFWVVDAPVSLMLHKALVSAGDVQRLDAAIERLRKRGELERIRGAYGGS